MLRTDGRMPVAERPGWSRARKTATYRAWRRNNAVKWHGVAPDFQMTYPLLVKKVSKRGEVHYA